MILQNEGNISDRKSQVFEAFLRYVRKSNIPGQIYFFSVMLHSEL